jgi:2'-5' RNA ligase
VKTSSPRGLHCTLRFLGDTAPETAASLGPAIARVVAEISAFSAELVGVGAFPNPQRPNVVWTGLSAPELLGLQQRLEELAVSFGYVPAGRPFQPHVTLARIKFRPPARLAELMREHSETSWGRFDVTEIELFQSTLMPSGSRYEILATAPLRR